MGKRARRVRAGHLVLVDLAIVVSGCGGGTSKLEFSADERGNFRALVAGKPQYSKQTLLSPAGQLTMATMESVDREEIRRIVVYTDFPDPIVDSSDPSALLDRGIGGMSGKGQWSVLSQAPITLDNHPGREVRFAINSPGAPEKGVGKARIFLIGNRLYQAIIVGPASNVERGGARPFRQVVRVAAESPGDCENGGCAAGHGSAQPTFLAQTTPPPQPRPTIPTPKDDPVPRPARVGPVTAPTREHDSADERVVQVGNSGPDPSQPAEIALELSKPTGKLFKSPEPNGNPRDRFSELAPEHGVLVGMRVGYTDFLGGSKVGAIKPIYQVGKTYVEGQRFGKAVRLSTSVVARPGYAVGAINTHTGLLLDAFQIVFMRFKEGHLDPDDSYATDWLGDSRGGGAGSASGEGNLVVGIHGRSNGREINMLGLLISD